MNIICENIRMMRKRCGLTQEELADQIGVTAQAVSRWESGVGLPDIASVVPLAKVLNVTTDALLGVGSENYDEVYLSNVKEKVKEIVCETSGEDALYQAEKQRKAYYFLKEEADKNPTNYALLAECIDRGASISMYTDFNDFLADQEEEKEAIFKDCTRRAVCIIRYSSDHVLVERAHNAMAWIYVHNKDFEKAREHAYTLPSYESNMMRETMLAQVAFFEHGFEAECVCIQENLVKLSNVVAKEFRMDLEDFGWNADVSEVKKLGKWMLEVAATFKKNPALTKKWEYTQNKLREYIQIAENRK